MHDGERERIGDALRKPGTDLLDPVDLPRLVDLPELRKAPDLPFAVAAGAGERGQRGCLDIGGMDLHEGIDEIEAERTPRGLRLETGRRVVRRHGPSRYVMT